MKELDANLRRVTIIAEMLDSMIQGWSNYFGKFPD